jgi:chromosome segregation ATPase
VPRTIRERPRYALLLGLGLACLVALGLVIGLLLAGGDESSDPAAERTANLQARELRETRAELEDAQAQLDSLEGELENVGDAVARQRTRAEAWRRRALRAERRNAALRRALTQAREE